MGLQGPPRRAPRDYLPLRVSLTDRTLRPFERRRLRTRRPFFEAMRERNPCLLARLRRLGRYVGCIYPGNSTCMLVGCMRDSTEDRLIPMQDGKDTKSGSAVKS